MNIDDIVINAEYETLIEQSFSKQEEGKSNFFDSKTSKEIMIKKKSKIKQSKDKK
ncbi:hypothetical protein DC914_RS25270 [Vibrio parahaemolyticus]|uniref:hypothetical protein n=1 Tax=Vibrio parahaemolyticus TaxID=670 RepID=UPI000AB16AD8|nr:hypothetical protein [Vibrio parahaemolyticus]